MYVHIYIYICIYTYIMYPKALQQKAGRNKGKTQSWTQDLMFRSFLFRLDPLDVEFGKTTCD